MNPAVAILLVFLGCCSNVVFLELIVKECPTSGNIITFAQFFLIALEGFIFTTKFGRKKPVIPLSTYGVMVALFFIVSVSNNYAFIFKVPMPMHMIFRAGSLMANLVLGVIILKKRYAFYKYVSVILITLGIICVTAASTGEMISDVGSGDGESKKTREDWLYMFFGIFILLFALFMSARMGIYQETVYQKHGKHPSEALFYNHALPLPFFLLFANDIYEHTVIFSNSAPLAIPMIGIGLPKLWVFLFANMITQYVCIRGVFILTTECSSLTVTLIVTLRKFVSLIFSVLYFRNPFTVYHLMGTSLVFLGTLLFTDVLIKIKNKLISTKEKVQ